MSDSCISCTLSTTQIQERRSEVLHKIRNKVQEQQSLPDGYILRFDADDDCLNELVNLIQLERKCCLFLKFRLTVEPNNGPVWLELTGPEGAKDFIRTEMELLP